MFLVCYSSVRVLLFKSSLLATLTKALPAYRYEYFRYQPPVERRRGGGSDSPQSSDVVEVGDGSADLLVVPGGGLWFVLDDVVLDLAGHVSVIGPGQSH